MVLLALFASSCVPTPDPVTESAIDLYMRQHPGSSVVSYCHPERSQLIVSGFPTNSKFRAVTAYKDGQPLWQSAEPVDDRGNFDHNDSTGCLIFRAWQPLYLNRPTGLPPYVLATNLGQHLVFQGLAAGTELQLALLSFDRRITRDDGQKDLAYAIGEMRTCTVPEDGSVAVNWSDCRLIQPY